MVFKYGEREGEGSNIDIFVGKIDVGVVLNVVKDVYGFVEVRDSVCLVVDEVV